MSAAGHSAGAEAQGPRLPTQRAAATDRSRRTRSTCKDRSSMELSTDSRASVSCFGFAVGTGLGNSELGIVERPLMPEPKPFQEAAIRSACESFKAAEGS